MLNDTEAAAAAACFHSGPVQTHTLLDQRCQLHSAVTPDLCTCRRKSFTPEHYPALFAAQCGVL